MLILAVSDIHAPHHLVEFRNSLRGIGHVDLALLGGDIVDGGRVEYYNIVLDLLKPIAGLVIAVPGNEEYDDRVKALKSVKGLILLNDEEYSYGGVRIIGSRGVLDKPTRWQERNIENIGEVYENRLRWIRGELHRGGNIILLTHYAPTYATLRGERESIYPMLGTRRLEDDLARLRVLAIHGHSHGSTLRCVKLGLSTVINVAFENLGKPILISYDNGSASIVSPKLECVQLAGNVRRQGGLDQWLA